MSIKRSIAGYRESTQYLNLKDKAYYILGAEDRIPGSTDIFPTFLIRELFFDMAKEIDKLNNKVEFLENRVEGLNE